MKCRHAFSTHGCSLETGHEGVHQCIGDDGPHFEMRMRAAAEPGFSTIEVRYLVDGEWEAWHTPVVAYRF